MAIDTTVHVDYSRYARQWQKNKDASRDLVHQLKEKYLPTNELPAIALNDPSNRQLNEYIKHKYNTQVWPMAVFFNFTRSTLSAWIGSIMAKKPQISFAESEKETKLDYLFKNADGAGNGTNTVAKLGLEATMETGGGGYLVVMPDATMTEQSVRDGSIAPRIKTYDRENILNYETSYINSNKVLTYLKIREFEAYSDKSTSELIVKHIEYFLDENGYVYWIVTRDNEYPGYPAEEIGDLIEAGKRATSIPFYWFGANDNEETPDPAPITPIANLNVLHYVLSSRHTQQCYDVGQGQYHIDLGNMENLTIYDDTGKPMNPLDALNPGGVKFGSVVPIVTANSGSVELIQLSTDSLLAEEPGKIEERAIKIGAQMITQDVNQTATASRIAFSGNTSNLITIADNVGMALKAAIMRIADVVGYDSSLVKCELNKKLITETLTAQDRTSFMQMVMQGVMPLMALFRILQRAGEVTDEMTFDDFKAEIEKDEGFFALRGVGTNVNNGVQ